MAYRIATNGDNVEFNNTPFSGYTFGGFTAAFLAKRNTIGGRQGVIFIVASAFTFPHFELGFETGAANQVVLQAQGSTAMIGPTVASTSLWYLVVVTGTSGGVPRWHVYDGTSWTHTTASGTFNAFTFAGTDRVFLSPPTAWGGEYVKADVVCTGFKKADSTDLQVQALNQTAFSSWQSFGFDWLVGFDAASSRVNSGGGTGGNEIARTGTSLVADPPGWLWVTPVTPVANFTGTPLTGSASLSVAFTDSSTNTPTSWAWDFGDGSTSISQNPTHSYTSSGTYTVVLTATNASGSNTKTRVGYVVVSETIAYAVGGGIDIY